MLHYYNDNNKKIASSDGKLLLSSLIIFTVAFHANTASSYFLCVCILVYTRSHQVFCHCVISNSKSERWLEQRLHDSCSVYLG